MRALAALCAALALLTAHPTGAAGLSLPPVPHYELPAPSLPQPAAPPRYTQNYEKSEPERNTKGNEGDYRKPLWQRIKDDPVAFVTLWLVIIAGLQAALFVWQLILIKLSLDDAKIAATAAGDSARGTLETAKILRNAQRPYLSPFNPELRNFGKAISEGDASLVMITVQLDIANVGRGVGFIRSYCITHEICAREREGKAKLQVNGYIGRLPLHQNEKWTVQNGTFHAFRISNAQREAIIEKEQVPFYLGPRAIL